MDAPSRSTGTQGAVGAVMIVLALGLILRIALLFLLPGSGFRVDLGTFQYWADYLATNGPWGFYNQDFLHDYTPGYMYVLWLVGLVGHAVGGIGDLIKIPAIVSDLAIGWLVYGMALELGVTRRIALVTAFVAVLNPISWFDSVVWGQVDSFGVVFLLLGLRELWRDRPERSAVYTVIAAIIKPQLGILVPLVAVVTIRRALRPEGGAGDPARTGRPIRIVTTALAGLLTAIVVCIPFGLTPLGLIEQLFKTGGSYPYVTVNAYNPWALIASDLGPSVAAGGRWACDAALGGQQCDAGVVTFGIVPALAIGVALLLGAFAAVLAVAARRPDRLTLLVALAVLALAFFVLPTRVHERYGYPFFALGLILAAVSWRWRIAYLVLSVATFANMYVVLTTLYPDNPSISDWLGIGDAIKSPPGIIAIVLAHAAGFVWVILQLRARALDTLADETADAGDADALDESGARRAPTYEPPGSPAPPTLGDPLARRPDGWALVADDGTRGRAPVRGAPATLAAPSIASTSAAAVELPTWAMRRSILDDGVVGWLRERWNERSIRPDRSASLVGERGARLDRLDLWLLAVLVVASLTLRMFRLDEPYQMHFDEVYHARTATEFLQDWRYGESHDIYEWTHPHLAKYLMALGIMAWGGDHVEATADLGVPVVDAVVEPRRDDPAAPDGRAGERLHVATGTQLRTYDLRTRALISTIAAPGIRALAIDPDGLELVLGFADGRVATLDPAALGSDAAASGVAPVDLGMVAGPVDRILLTSDGASIAVATGTTLEILDRSSGASTGSLDLDGINGLADGGTGAALVATLADVPDPSEAAAAVAQLIGGNRAAYLTKLQGQGPTAILGDPGDGDTRKAVDAAIADGRLAGIEVSDVSRVAVATDAGLTFVDAGSATTVSTIPMIGGAHGIGAVRLDDPKLYVTSGTAAKPEYHVVVIGGDPAKDGPVDQGTHPMPGLGSDVSYDPASQMVHILGRAPGAGAGGPFTVYVVEPHGNAVYADARLADGFVPTALAMDVNADYPSDDRQQMLVLDATGGQASIDVGSHEFSWRVPGVIAGTLTLICLYLLTRILFRRRLVAALVGLFVLIDGMFFVQARIGMNDIYVGLFIVAAYTLFAAIWTGWWRARAAFWLAMPVIGLLLGLALASKWVGLYALGGVALLILARSALGRVLVVLSMIALTGVLGYMAISVPAGQGIGNLLFLLVMIVLTLVAVVVAVLHPVAWTDDEMRFALAVPAAAAGALFFGALATGHLDSHLVLGPLALTPQLGAIGLALGSVGAYLAFVVGGRLGFGPLAGPPGPADPARSLPAPSPAADGWLRPGWAFGLPVLWTAVCLVAIPFVVYVVSYIPWAMVENHRITDTWPPGHTGQTLLELTRQMYGYHNGLTDPHPASSPWWAWPLDLKPVWFYQEGLAGGTSAAIYDAGNLVIWWIGIAALVFVAVMAYRRRSPALALIVIGFAAQWIPWARIDRAAFQYHYYTALPFVVMALAYFIAELWHGPSRFAWRLARLGGAVAIVLPAAMWFATRPLCAVVGVESVNAGSAACPPVIPDFILTARSAAQAVAIGIALFVVVRTLFDMTREGADERRRLANVPRLLIVTIAATIALVAASLVGETTILSLQRLPVEPVVLIAGVPLAWLALTVLGARDPRRYVVGFIAAATGWFVILYPNIAALPLPSSVVNAYQGILPTYLYAFQFSVSRIDRNAPMPLFTPLLGVLVIAIAATCVVVAYSARTWRLSSIERGSGDPSDDPDGLARSGGA